MRLTQSTAAPRSLRRVLAALSLLAGLAGLPGLAPAADLDDTTCADLRDTRDALISLGVQSDMQHGPRWAADNLAPDRISRIKRYLVSMEQVLFRCGSLPREPREGMEFAANMPDPKPFHDRRTFPLPVRKPPVPVELRSAVQ